MAMSAEQGEAYQKLASSLTQQLKEALRKRDTTLLGVVLNTLLAWPDCCFRAKTFRHPRRPQPLPFTPAQSNELENMPKERKMLDIGRAVKSKCRTTLCYLDYTGATYTTWRWQMTW